ncbi:spore germination protein [Pontibacillus yanchengensis]|uniref:Spore germination protein n=3 Tax=Pontibacillus yanchengensis TaxID=462910 RepID=A0ACC7VDA0_9BACI|nr:spore germination protein [Pontibacillus yanchengensis]MYL52758.1 spore germination protein [Pontibacillus yanchengensis]
MEESIPALINRMEQSKDFIKWTIEGPTSCILSYYTTLVDSKIVNRHILPTIKEEKRSSLDELQSYLPLEKMIMTDDPEKIKNYLLQGFVFIQMEERHSQGLLIPASKREGRKISIPEVEFSVVGPKEAFVESIDTNINLVRKRITKTQLTIEEVSVGSYTETRIAILYIDEIADKENVQTVLQRLHNINYDQVIDSSFISQMISDNSNSPFPLFLDTERPDRTVEALIEGKISIIVDGSPHSIIAPSTFTEFLSSSDDYFIPWPLASTFRLIRLFAVLFSVLITSLYVAVLTHHVEMIPDQLMATIVTSRANIPFPPILEVIILEFAIELLREAGARLPSKIGQTIGIVGGIVIGTAAVDAGLTSNVLLILVALGALASFTTPVYQFSNTIRLIRFPFIIGAQIWGVLGIGIISAFLIGHLIQLKSIGRPFLAPLYPTRLKDLKDAFIRLPFNKQYTRPFEVRPTDPTRFNKSLADEKRDIDE